MISIQDIGKEIFSNNPRKFYAFLGPEFGIKSKYLDKLSDYYEGRVIESESVRSLFDSMKHKKLILEKPNLYICRYDSSFLPTINDKTDKEIDSLSINGTIVCIYQDEKNLEKFEKYLPNRYVIIDSVSKQYVEKYLLSEFNSLNLSTIRNIISMADSYGQCRIICNEIQNSSRKDDISYSEISSLCGKYSVHSEEEIKMGIANRNFAFLLSCIDDMDSPDSLLYNILSCMIELDKIADSKYSESYLRKFSNKWTREDIYYMFMHTYSVLEILRSDSCSDTKSIVSCLICLLNFERIPSGDEISWK